eukprot:scaffold35367_cov233-Skeletonema_dohrnii-CCMP3373.AAC.1
MSGKDVARDIVSVDIRGPHCEDLTLIDLPGIVRTTGKNESATLAEDIQGLINDYLKNPRCVILAVLPCNVDFHNSQIMADALKVDPSTERTIPVLTKPDLIDKGGERAVKDLLLGSKTQSFDCGFHMAKGRGQEALDKKQSIEDGLTAEESYFQNTEPWRGVEDKNLFGTKNLRIKLAELQMKLIQSSFMSIVSDLKSQRDESLELLNSLGAIPLTLSDKKALFRGIKEEIWSGMGSQTLDGRICSLHNDTEMRPSARFLDASTRYQTTLSKSKLANISEVVVGRKAIAYDKDKEKYDHGTVCFIDQSKGKVYLEEFVCDYTPESSVTQKKKGIPGNIIQDSNEVWIEKPDGSVKQLYAYDLETTRSDPAWISELIKHNRPYKLPIFINTYVFEAIVADLIEREWMKPTMELLESTSKVMEAAAEAFIKELKEASPFHHLQTYLITKAAEVVDALTRETKSRVLEFVKREEVPYTQNHYLFENVCKLRSQRLMDEVTQALPEDNGSSISVNPKTLRATVKNIFQRNQERSVDEHMAEEMQHALNAYGKVALKRFIDTIPMICVEVMQKFANNINHILSDTSDDEIERFVTAPSNTVAKMNKLKRKADTLEKGIEALGELY